MKFSEETYETLKTMYETQGKKFESDLDTYIKILKDNANGDVLSDCIAANLDIIADKVSLLRYVCQMILEQVRYDLECFESQINQDDIYSNP
jgi:hypothetical protein